MMIRKAMLLLCLVASCLFAQDKCGFSTATEKKDDGTWSVLGQDSAGNNPAGAKKKVEERYKNDDILMVWMPDKGEWKRLKELSAEEKAAMSTKSLYLVSHGLNDQYNAEWINNTADALTKTQDGQVDDDIVVLSVNWDEFSGTKDDKNFLASTWINAVSEVIRDELKSEIGDVKLQAAIAHSYGAHLLADVIGHEDKGFCERFIALDPAEETLTFTGKKDDGKGQEGKSTPMWNSNKKSKNWNLHGKTITETYKSSVWLGGEECQGDFNYILADSKTFTPAGVLGDWGEGEPLDETIPRNHSDAPYWYALEVKKKNASRTAGQTPSVGGWFNQEVLDKNGEGATESQYRGQGHYQGIVNTRTDNQLEYCFSPDEQVLKGEKWGLAVQIYAAHLSADQKTWENTVLKADKQPGFDSTHNLASLRKKSDTVNGAIIDYLKKQNYNSTDKEVNAILSIYKKYLAGQDLTDQDLKDMLRPTLGELDNAKLASLKKFLKEKLRVEVSASATLQTAENGANNKTESKKQATLASQINQTLQTNQTQPVNQTQNVNIQNTNQGSTGSNSNISSVSTVVSSSTITTSLLGSKTTPKNLAVKAITSLIDKGITSLSKKYPWVGQVFQNGTTVVNVVKDIYNAFKSSTSVGDFFSQVMKSSAVQKVLTNAINTGLNYLINKFVTPFVNKLITKVSNWAGNAVDTFLNNIGVKGSTNMAKKIEGILQSLYKKGVSAGIKWIDDQIIKIFPSPGTPGGIIQPTPGPNPTVITFP